MQQKRSPQKTSLLNMFYNSILTVQAALLLCKLHFVAVMNEFLSVILIP